MSTLEFDFGEKATIEYIMLIRIKNIVDVLFMYFVFIKQKEACAFCPNNFLKTFACNIVEGVAVYKQDFSPPVV